MKINNEEKALALTEEVFDGVTKKMIEDFKKEYGQIYKIEIENNVYIYRKLKRKDYVEIMKNGGSILENQETITRTVVIHPLAEQLETLIENNAGVATIISDDALERSGFKITKESEEL